MNYMLISTLNYRPHKLNHNKLRKQKTLFFHKIIVECLCLIMRLAFSPI